MTLNQLDDKIQQFRLFLYFVSKSSIKNAIRCNKIVYIRVYCFVIINSVHSSQTAPSPRGGAPRCPLKSFTPTWGTSKFPSLPHFLEKILKNHNFKTSAQKFTFFYFWDFFFSVMCLPFFGNKSPYRFQNVAPHCFFKVLELWFLILLFCNESEIYL